MSALYAIVDILQQFLRSARLHPLRAAYELSPPVPSYLRASFGVLLYSIRAVVLLARLGAFNTSTLRDPDMCRSTGCSDRVTLPS